MIADDSLPFVEIPYVVGRIYIIVTKGGDFKFILETMSLRRIERLRKCVRLVSDSPSIPPTSPCLEFGTQPSVTFNVTANVVPRYAATLAVSEKKGFLMVGFIFNNNPAT